jgi:ADP-ribosylation factor-binding protein GGA
MCEEESNDSEAVAKLLEINDSIHRTVERYKLIKKGDVEAASKIPKGTLGTSTGVVKNAANELSLIDFDPEPRGEDGRIEAASGAKATTVEDDLLGLSIQEEPSGAVGGISLGFGANSGIPGVPLLSSTMPQNSAAPPPTTPAPPQPPRPNYEAFSAVAGSQPPSKPASPSPMPSQQKAAQTTHVSTDPFAALISADSRASSPFRRQAAAKPTPASSSSLLDLADTSSQAASAPSSPNGAATDDEWNFASSLPESTLATSQQLEVHSSSIKIEFIASRDTGQQSIYIVAHFSNQTARPIHRVHFQVAVEKVCGS